MEGIELAKTYLEKKNNNSDDPVRALSNMVYAELKDVNIEIFHDTKWKILDLLKEAVKKNLSQPKEIVADIHTEPSKYKKNSMNRFRTIPSSSYSSSTTLNSSWCENLPSIPVNKSLTSLNSSSLPHASLIIHPTSSTPIKNNNKNVNVLDIQVVKDPSIILDTHQYDETSVDEYYADDLIEECYPEYEIRQYSSNSNERPCILENAMQGWF